MNIGAGIGIGFQELFSKAFRYDTTIACQNGSDVTPVIKLPGGTFSATPAGLSLNSTTGVIDVSASTVGTYTVTYSIGPTEDTITIQAADDSSFSYSSTSFRQNASNPAPTITGLVGGVFSGPTGIIFADSGTNNNSSSGIINLAASTVGGPYTITYTTTGNCPTSSTFDITVQVALSITYSATSFCEDGGNTAAPTVVGDPGSGTFASTTGLTINSTTGVINTDTSTPDENTPYTVTYTASTGETATTQVTIKNLDNATFSYSATSFCENASNQTPSITTPGGTFTSQDITFRPFQMQFEVASGVSKTITIPTTVGSSFTVDWGDGATTTETGGSISHTYNDGTNTDVTNPIVSLGAESDSGPLVRMLFNNSGSASDLLAVTQWGDIAFNYLFGMFMGCNNSNFTISATDTPDFSNATRADNMFYDATNVSGNFNSFTMGTITQFPSLFRNATNFNEDISNWDVSSAINFSGMFRDATNFNQDISSWNTGNVTNLLSAFLRASSFNQNVNSWDTSSVTTMTQCFYGCTNFNQNLSDWNISSLTTAVNMFGLNTNLSVANYTDTVVGWAVFVYNNSGSPASIQWTGTTPNFDGTRTSDADSGQTYAAKYGANWTATGWTNSQDAFDYLTTTLSWTIN